MKLVVLPFNASEGTSPALGRQISNFASDAVRTAGDIEVNTISLLTQVEQEGVNRVAMVNISEDLLEPKWIADLFTQTGAELAMDGLLKKTGDESFEATLRFHEPNNAEPIFSKTFTFTPDTLFDTLRGMIVEIANHTKATPKDGVDFAKMDFGTDNPRVFLKFLEAYDALMYVQQANGPTVLEFSAEPAMDMLLEAAKEDPEFDGPYQALIGLCRAAVARRLGTFQPIEQRLLELADLHPDDFTANFALGEAYQSINEPGRAAEQFEKAVAKRPDDPALYVRLGMAQLASGMPVNAERNFRRAIDLEDDDKPSMDYLANVLTQTNREHEVPGLWKGVIDKSPQSSQAHAKYALSLLQAGRTEEAERAFEDALSILEDKSFVKRFYAPLLVQKGELDRAMDFYEDCLDVAPNDVQVLLEYAQTLQQANREFEIPQVLRNVLASNPDPNTRAQTLAWQIELEQPKRVENVQNAEAKMESGDHAGAIRDLKPLRNWLADYWKLWALLAAAHNRLGESTEAEAAARRLLELFPGCEPGYGELLSALNGQGRNDEAYDLMRFASQNNPQSLPIHVNLALAAARAGHTEEARALARHLREAIGGNPELSKELEPVFIEIEQ
ncbi:MAG TPA: tetratricopeptide repeat protein [Fimbriimonadaceae bacterium]|nr:tetratricopeptide repeat protein [Fimbriimonadaceae bacterium]